MSELTDTTPSGRHRGRRGRLRPLRIVMTGTVIVIGAAIVVLSLVGWDPARLFSARGRPPAADPMTRGPFFGVYAVGAPQSYAGVAAFTAGAEVSPNLVVYYSGWPEQFQPGFAARVVRHGAVPLVQIDPTGANISGIASGQYDAYLRSYASAVKSFGGRVVLSFGHEMNGHWYSWGYRHTPPPVFVAAWRHIVTVFRRARADNVTWLWTVNVLDSRAGIPSPAAWWPGNSYVNWVGIDGYYINSSLTFASLFGPTIKAVRALTLDPILVSETAVAPQAGQPAKIADLFAGVRSYGLLGFIWFDATGVRDWRLSSPTAFAALRRGAEQQLKRPPS